MTRLAHKQILKNKLNHLEEALRAEQQQSAELQKRVLQEQETVSRAATQESTFETELQLLHERIGALTAENASLRDDNGRLRGRCIELEASLDTALHEKEPHILPPPPMQAIPASAEALAIARKEIERERDAILANAREYAASLMSQAQARSNLSMPSQPTLEGNSGAASESFVSTSRNIGAAPHPEPRSSASPTSTSNQVSQDGDHDKSQISSVTSAGKVSGYFPATSGTPQLGNKGPIRQTTLEDITSIKHMLSAMESGTGLRCAVFAVDKHSGRLVGKPVLLKKTSDRAYKGHVRIDCEVYTPWTPPSSPQTTSPHEKCPEKPTSLLPPFPASLGKRAIDSTSVDKDGKIHRNTEADDSVGPTILSASKKVKTLRFGVGDIQMIRTGSGTVTLPGGVKDNRTLVLTVQGKGELNFVMATVTACQRVHTLFSQLIAHPTAIQPPSLRDKTR